MNNTWLGKYFTHRKPTEICARCNGERWVIVKDRQGNDILDRCPDCGAEGFMYQMESGQQPPHLTRNGRRGG